jgi:hypothetical protein
VSARQPAEPGKPEPLAMTDAEVGAMARGETTKIARRIARHRATRPIGRLVGDKPGPPRISAAEMAEIQQASGRLPDPVRERLQKAVEADVAPEPKRPHKRKISPTKEPPRQS